LAEPARRTRPVPLVSASLTAAAFPSVLATPRQYQSLCWYGLNIHSNFLPLAAQIERKTYSFQALRCVKCSFEQPGKLYQSALTHASGALTEAGNGPRAAGFAGI